MAPNPFKQLQRALEQADSEMRAAHAGRSLKEVRGHGEAVVNILGGFWGRWYGDGDGDGAVNDPSDRYGVLPPEKVQSAAPDTPAGRRRTVGWAIAAYEQGNRQAQHEIQAHILGDVASWKTRVRARYDEIERAVAGSDTKRNLVGKLAGASVRALAWGRLILVKARTLEEAHAYAASALADTQEALDAARRIGG